MQMVGHEDVRENCELEETCVVKKLLGNASDQRLRCEDRTPEGSAGSQEISLIADIRHAVEATRPFRDHGIG